MIVATAGHVDHGKTSLVGLLTGVQTDRLEEEQARGLTIDLGFAHTVISGIEIGFVDVPGHIRFINNMLAGVSSVDVALLVIAADDGVMPQTIEVPPYTPNPKPQPLNPTPPKSQPYTRKIP